MPGDCIDCLAVGSVTAQGLRSNFSSLGPTEDGRIKPDVMAMGSGVKLLNSQNQVVTKNGTSLSAPQIAGLASGLWERYPELTSTELLNAIRMSSDRAFSPDNFYGYGIPHYYGVVNYLETNNQVEDIRIFPNPVDEAKLYFKVKDPFEINSINYSLVNMNGQEVSKGGINFSWANFEKVLDIGGLNNGLYILRVQYGDVLLTRRIVVR